MMNRFLCLIACAFCLPCACLADEAPVKVDARFLTTEGRVLVGRLTNLTGKSATIQTPDQLETLALSKLLRIDHVPAKPVYGSRWLIVLANGDNLFVDARPKSIAIDDLDLTCQFPVAANAEPVAIPLETVRGIVMHVPESSRQRDGLLRQMESSRDKGDVFVLRAGDRVVGSYRELGPDGFELDVGKSVTKLKMETVQWMRINPELVSIPKTNGPTVLVRLTDGSRLTATQLEWLSPTKNETLARINLHAAFGKSISVPVNRIASIQPLGHGPVYLSELKPVDFKFTPFLSRIWHYQLDRSVNRRPLRVHGNRFDKGVGLHSQCRLTYELGGRFSGFRTVVDLDDSASELGNAVCRIELDGKPTWSSGPLTRPSPPATVGLLDVSNCKRMTIVVDFGARGDIQDHVDLIDAVLIPK